jgi:hypothetical protein
MLWERPPPQEILRWKIQTRMLPWILMKNFKGKRQWVVPEGTKNAPLKAAKKKGFTAGGLENLEDEGHLSFSL